MGVEIENKSNFGWSIFSYRSLNIFYLILTNKKEKVYPESLTHSSCSSSLLTAHHFPSSATIAPPPPAPISLSLHIFSRSQSMMCVTLEGVGREGRWRRRRVWWRVPGGRGARVTGVEKAMMEPGGRGMGGGGSSCRSASVVARASTSLPLHISSRSSTCLSKIDIYCMF